MKRFTLLCCLLLIFSSYSVLGLGVFGEDMFVKLMFEPNFRKEYTYSFVNNDGVDANYKIFAERHSGAPMYDYFTIEPESYDNVLAGETRKFKIILTLPEKMDRPGISETRVWVRGIPINSGGGMTASPVVGVRFQVFVLFPYPYIEWSFRAASLNEGETADFIINAINYGEPVIEQLRADVEIISLETENVVDVLHTDSVVLSPKASAEFKIPFNAAGYVPGNYRARATLHYDENLSVRESDFMIGTQYVNILNYTKEFEKSAINRMDLEIESRWNSPINDIYAQIDIFNNSRKVHSFKSLNTNLGAWEKKVLVAYFDTKGLPLGEYDANILLKYEGSTTEVTGPVYVLDQADTTKTDKLPSLIVLGAELFTSTNLLILILIIFIIVNLVLILGKRKKSRVTPDVISQLKQVVKDKKLTREKLVKMLEQKGWTESEISEIAKKVLE